MKKETEKTFCFQELINLRTLIIMYISREVIFVLFN